MFVDDLKGFVKFIFGGDYVNEFHRYMNMNRIVGDVPYKSPIYEPEENILATWGFPRFRK